MAERDCVTATQSTGLDVGLCVDAAAGITPKAFNSIAQGQRTRRGEGAPPWVCEQQGGYAEGVTHAESLGPAVLCNAFGVNAFGGLRSQGARLRRDPGLWSLTASR